MRHALKRKRVKQADDSDHYGKIEQKEAEHIMPLPRVLMPAQKLQTAEGDLPRANKYNKHEMYDNKILVFCRIVE